MTSTLAQGLFTPYQFAGQGGYYSDGGSGMHFLGHRYYLPKVGRFLTQDPIGQAGGLNLYAYTDNNPVDTIDLGGLRPVEGVAPENPPMDTGPTPPLPDIRYNSDPIAGISNFAAGWGDALTAPLLGGTGRLRDYITWEGVPVNAALDFDSGEYNLGTRLGGIHDSLLARGRGITGFVSSIIGRNPRPGGNRINTDLPGDRAVAKSIFRHLTRGRQILENVLANGGRRRNTPDNSVQIRMNPDGSTRVDIVHPGGPRETIHF